jgi:hypothetical protein
MGQGRTNCLDENPSPGYYLTIQSYEKDTIDGLIDVNVILTADDTVFMGNLFQLSFENFLTGSQNFSNSRDSLLPGDTINFTLSASYDTSGLPFYPVSIDLLFKDSLADSAYSFSNSPYAKAGLILH